MKNFKKIIILAIMQTNIYKWLLDKVIPYIRFTTYYTSFKGYKYYLGYNHLKPGDIILTNDSKKLTALLIPGDWSHAAMCVSKDGNWEVSEMTHNDYTKSTFFDICKEATRVAIFRLQNNDQDYISKMINTCKSFSEAKYDTDFSLGIKALYCSELVYLSDPERRIEANLEDFVGIGREYISPTGLANAKGVIKIWDSKEEK